jgi:uncharacterized protein HemX
MRKTKLNKWQREAVAKRERFRKALNGANIALKVLFDVSSNQVHHWNRDLETLQKAHNVIAGALVRYPRKA